MDRQEALITFKRQIAGLAPAAIDDAQWPTIRVRVRTFVGVIDIPDVLISSVRSVVLRRGQVVLVRERTGESHVTPGGRREAGESIEATVRREVLEECGWHVGRLVPIGCFYIVPLDPAPPADFKYFWGEMIHLIHASDGVRYEPRARDRTQIEEGSRLQSVKRAMAEIPAGQRAILNAARSALRI